MNILDLPEDCVSKILSLTSPKDVIRSSAVSKHFLSVSESDTVWEHFLPRECRNVMLSSCSLIPRQQVVSERDMFRYLSRFPILLENSTMSFALDKWSGKICYMLGARALSVIWGSNPGYWSWEFVPDSRFPECAVLKDVRWLEIKGQIQTTLLSPGTAYGAYFVFKTKANSFSAGFGRTPVKVSVSEIREDGFPRDDHHITKVKSFYLKAPRSEEFGFDARGIQRSVGELPVVRDDGWMEIEMGRYHVDVNNAESVMLEMTLKEVEISHWKLVVCGFEVRPLC